MLKDAGRVTYAAATDKEVVAAFHRLSREEGIMPALESSHAVAFAEKLAPTMKKGQILVVNISGRGDKDLGIIQDYEKESSGDGHA
jgi:tryptophan synthase beta chain